MKRALGLFVASILSLSASSAAGQEAEPQGMRACSYDLECGPTASCSPRGRCVPHGQLETGESSTEECGNDRRCRIDRLKRKKRAERHLKTVEEERWAREQIEEQQREIMKAKPRLADPISADIRVSRLGVLGLHAGYVFGGRFQPEFEFTHLPYRYVFTRGDASIDGNLTAWFLRGGVSYFLLDTPFSPYLTAGFQYGTGRFETYSFDTGFDFTSNGTQVKFHAAEVGGGVDLQFGFGMHTRLGAVYRPLIYNQARNGPGSYDPFTRDGLESWYKQAASIDVVWLLGWAF